MPPIIPLINLTPVYAKQPWEEVPYTIDIRKYVPDGVTISTVAFRVYLPGDDPETEAIDEMAVGQSHDGNTKLQIRVGGGETGTTYRVRIRVQGSVGRYEIEGEFYVLEKV